MRACPVVKPKRVECSTLFGQTSSPLIYKLVNRSRRTVCGSDDVVAGTQPRCNIIDTLRKQDCKVRSVSVATVKLCPTITRRVTGSWCLCAGTQSDIIVIIKFDSDGLVCLFVEDVSI